LGYWVILPGTCLILAGLLAAACFTFAVGAVAAGIVCTPLAVFNILRVAFLVRIGRKGWDAKVERRLA
jgi:polyferredoxin